MHPLPDEPDTVTLLPADVSPWSVPVYDIRPITRHLAIGAIRGEFMDEDEPSDFTVGTLDYLMRAYWLGVPYPAPLLPEHRDDPEMAARWCFGVHGQLAWFAALGAMPAG